jgi:hypothetical protein
MIQIINQLLLDKNGIYKEIIIANKNFNDLRLKCLVNDRATPQAPDHQSHEYQKQ